ncbi:MAG: DNA repair protein RadA [Lachnospiraceae bacterium]|nr:DNA repair protein RadA [Lachnospiraceae bacterium]
MAKSKTVFFCKECGFETPKWVGQCPGCKEWNTLTEEPVVIKSVASRAVSKVANEPKRLNEISTTQEDRILTGVGELDRVLGGGIVVGGLCLVGGDPGIGKSTLLLQMCQHLLRKDNPCNVDVMYISGEESLHQIKMRANRLGEFERDMLLLCETNLDVIEETILKHKPSVVVIDSIQTLFKEELGSAPGSVSQVREITTTLMRIAKDHGISVFIIGHVTKEGVVAGPRVLEHMVDTVLYLEGDANMVYRILRAVKNRFGSTNEIGVFEMRTEGLREVLNPSEYMLQGRPEAAAGSVVSCSVEGSRTLLVEIQALLCRTSFNYPKRTAAGVDFNRVNLLLAVIEKKLGLSIGDCDAYVNIAGGIRINEPALDLALVAAVISSYRNQPIGENVILFGEVGLTGEVRAVTMLDQRVMEAAKLGFKCCILPKANKDRMEIKSQDLQGMKIVGISNIRELVEYF